MMLWMEDCRKLGERTALYTKMIHCGEGGDAWSVNLSMGCLDTLPFNVLSLRQKICPGLAQLLCLLDCSCRTPPEDLGTVPLRTGIQRILCEERRPEGGT